MSLENLETNLLHFKQVDPDQGNFTIVNNSIINNPDLDWESKGLLIYLISRPPDWKVIIGDLVNRATNGRDAVYTILRNLKRTKYLKLVKENDEKGHMKYFYEVYKVPFENPDPPKPDGRKKQTTELNPKMLLPHRDNPLTDIPDKETPIVLNTDINKNNYTNTYHPPLTPPKILEKKKLMLSDEDMQFLFSNQKNQGEEVGGGIKNKIPEEEEKDIFSPEEKSPEDYLFFDMAAKPFYITSEAFKSLLDKYGFTKLKSAYNILADEILINPNHGIKNPLKILSYRLENFREKQNNQDEDYDLFTESEKVNSNLKTDSKNKFNDLFWYCNKTIGTHPSINFNINKDRVGRYFLEHYYKNYLNPIYSDEETKQELNNSLLEVKKFVTPDDFQSLIMEYVDINQVGPSGKTFANEFVLKSFLNHYLKINEIKCTDNSERQVK